MAKSAKSKVRPEEPAPPKTLAGFIEANYRLASVFGIFVAVAAFASNLPIKALGIALSFLFLVAAVLVWLEILRKFQSGRGSWLLYWFETALTLITFAIILYALIQFRTYLIVILPIALVFLFLGIFSDLAKTFDVFNRVFHAKPGERTFLRYLFAILSTLLFLLLAATLSAVIAYFVVSPLTSRLDSVSKWFQELVPR